ncbi:MAG TPA: YihY/virulence factor BrkB family protein [Candidatus Baltobacteraceae bacterium]
MRDIPLRMHRFFFAFREAALRFSRDGCAFLAQALAFNAIFAVFPLMVLFLTLASYINILPEQRLLGFIDTLAPTLQQYLADNLKTYIYDRGVTSIVAAVILVWSGKNLFMGLAFALNRAVGVPKGRPILHDIVLSLVMLPIVGIVLLIAMVLPFMISLGIALAGLPDGRHLGQIGAYGVSLLLVFVVTSILYSYLPNRRLKWHFGLPGATFAAVMWPIVQFAFAQYLTRVDFTHVYGALSAPLVLLLWFYLMASIFLFGAQLSSAWASQSGNPAIPRLVDAVDPLDARSTAT